MASGSRRKRGNDEYVFIDGHAMRSDEVVRIDLRDSEGIAVPGQNDAVSVPGQEDVKKFRRTADNLVHGDNAVKGTMRRGWRKLKESDAFALTKEAQEGELPFEQTVYLMQEDRRILHTKYLVCGGVLLALALLSLCISSSLPGTFNSLFEVASSIGAWFRLTYTQLFHADLYTSVYREIHTSMPYYSDCILQVWMVFKYIACGALLAVSGMLYQNTFRNPIAAPSMLGVSNGINFALLILVLQYGYTATQHMDLYYLYSMIGGIGVLLLVMIGGKWISGKGRFNVVNMILMGTIISQLLGIVMTYVQAIFMDDAMYEAYYQLQNATGVRGVWTYAVLIIGSLVSLVPIFAFCFRLNLVSFSDQESRLLGVNPNRLRLLSLGCGSIMILVAQLTVGQVSMVSLIIPFIVRAVFGSEFRKQLGGNILVGALLLLICGDAGTLIMFDGSSVGISMVVSVVAIPLFVWMLAIRQRSWE